MSATTQLLSREEQLRWVGDVERIVRMLDFAGEEYEVEIGDVRTGKRLLELATMDIADLVTIRVVFGGTEICRHPLYH